MAVTFLDMGLYRSLLQQAVCVKAVFLKSDTVSRICSNKGPLLKLEKTQSMNPLQDILIYMFTYTEMFLIVYILCFRPITFPKVTALIAIDIEGLYEHAIKVVVVA